MSGFVKKKIMWIDVQIPFDEQGMLAGAYNRALADGSSEWVLFLDHDVFLCNPRWYKMCVEAVNFLEYTDPKAVCVGCECGGEHHKRTMEESGILAPNANIDDHIEQSKKVYFEYGGALERVYSHIPGFFMLLKRKVAREIGFYQQTNGNINRIDVDFGKRLMAADYHIYQMRGLYIYHRRGMRHLKKDFITQNG